MKNKHSFRRVTALLLAALMLALAIPFAVLPTSAATVSSVTVSGNGAIANVSWKAGYIGSHSNRNGEAWKEIATSYSSAYRVSDVIVVPQAGTTIRFSEYCDGTAASIAQDKFSISSWKQVNGAWVIDPAGVELAGNPAIETVKPHNYTLGIQYYQDSTSTMYYTYTTTKDNEAIRFTIYGKTESGYLGEGEGPTVYAYKPTFTEGATAGAGTVEGIQWYTGYVASVHNTNFGQPNNVVDYAVGSRYHYSQPIIVPKAGTTVTMTDPSASYTIGSNLYPISAWTVGKDGLLDFLYGTPGTNAATYSYTTTYDNEIIRFCQNTWTGAAGEPDATISYVTNSTEKGTLALAGYQPNNLGLVQELSWTLGIVDANGVRKPSGSAYAYSSVISVFGKGVTVSFTDNDAEGKFATAGCYVFSFFTDATGTTFVDGHEPIIGTDDTHYTDANGARTYTYTTTEDVTYLRISYRSGAGQTIFPIVYMTAPNTVDYAEELEGLNVLAIGDSLLDPRSLWSSEKNAEGSASDTTGAYYEADRQFIMQAASKYGWRCINYGISGSSITTSYGNGMINRWNNMQGGETPDLIIFEGGRNDYNGTAPLGTPDSYDTTTVSGAVNTILDGLLAKYPNALIICITGWDYGNTSYSTDKGEGRCEEYMKAFHDVVALRSSTRVKIIDAYDRNVIPAYVDNDTFVKLYGMSDTDRSHFNADGMDVLAPYYEYQIAEFYRAYLTTKIASGQTGVYFQNAAGTTISTANTTTATTIPAPYVPATRGGVLVGWVGTLNGQTAILPANGDISFAAGDTGTFIAQIYLNMTAKQGISLRFTEGSTGMRFQTEVGLADWNALSRVASSLQLGTLIVPQSYVDAMGGELTHTALEKAEKQYLDVQTGGWYIEGAESATFAGSIANIKASNHARFFTAAGYVKVTYSNGDVRYHYAENFTDSTDQVYTRAYAALHDRSNTQTGNYVNEVTTGSWSPYNSYQINVLKGYLRSVISLTSSTALGGVELTQSSIYSQTGMVLTAIAASEDSSDEDGNLSPDNSSEWAKYSAILGTLADDASGVVVIRATGSTTLTQYAGVALEGALMDYMYYAEDNVILIPFFTYSDFH